MFRDGFVRSQCMMPMSRCQRHDVAEGDSCAVLVHRAHALWSYKVLAITYLTFAIYSTEIKIQGLCCVNRSICDILDWVINDQCHTGYSISVQYLNCPLCPLSLTTLYQRVHVYICTATSWETFLNWFAVYEYACTTWSRRLQDAGPDANDSADPARYVHITKQSVHHRVHIPWVFAFFFGNTSVCFARCREESGWGRRRRATDSTINIMPITCVCSVSVSEIHSCVDIWIFDSNP